MSKALFFIENVCANQNGIILEIDLTRIPDKGERVIIDNVEWRVNNITTHIHTTPLWDVAYTVHIFKPQGNG